MNSRYARQVRFAPIGEQGQAKIQNSSVGIVGCGALGSVIAETLSRAGVGKLVLIDRDLIEESNLQRQFLYDMDDFREGMPKVEAAKRRIAKINPTVHVQAENRSLSQDNIQELLSCVDLILDGTDNFPTRYLMNQFAVDHQKPWIYGAAVGSYGLSMSILPHDTACLSCVFPQAPSAENSPNCETAGVIAPITTTIASIESAEALKILSGHRELVSRELVSIDLWQSSIHSLRPKRREDCPSCGVHTKPKPKGTPALSASSDLIAESLCGQNAVQISLSPCKSCDLESESKRLAGKVQVLSLNKFLVRFSFEGREASLFPDGRVIVKETTDTEFAKEFYRKLFC